LKVTESPDKSKILIALYNLDPKDGDKAIYYMMVDLATRKAFTKTFKLQEKSDDYPVLHLSNVIDNEGVIHILRGTMKDRGIHFLSFMRDDKIPNFADLALVKHNFLSADTKICLLT
jgi:hypothetical protein